jgi:pimeloyl-ACP methyl ester carboxylesterase
MRLHHETRGAGRPLLLLHGLGGSWRSWSTVLDALAAEREVIVPDLPGFGETPPLAGEVSIATLADAVTAFLDARGLRGVDAVGSSMGARLVLELARRGVVGATVSLDPGGFWQGWEQVFFYDTVASSYHLVRALQPAMPALTASAVGRTALFAQFSARPWAVPADVALTEMRTFAAGPSFIPLLRSLVHGPAQQGAAAGTTPGPITIGWGRHDRVCLPARPARAGALPRRPAALVRALGPLPAVGLARGDRAAGARAHGLTPRPTAPPLAPGPRAASRAHNSD